MRRAAISLMLAATLYEGIARSGAFPAVLVPTLPTVARGLMEGVLDGSLPGHALSTLYRVLLGMGLAIVICLPLGILMGRYRSVEAFFLPLASALMPIPSLAWVPLFIRSVSHAAQRVVRGARGQPLVVACWQRHGRQRARSILEGDRARSLFIHHHGIAPSLSACLDRGGGRRDAGRLRLGARLGDLRRQGVPQSRSDAGLAGRHWLHRVRISSAANGSSISSTAGL
jgi:hypothetical protein